MTGARGSIGRRVGAWLSAEGVPAGRDMLWLGLLGLLVLGAGLGLRDPWPPDEPRFALAARDMVATGHWLFPRVGGVLYPDKPPVFMWLQALVLQATGWPRVAFLLPSIGAAVGTLLLTYDLGRRLWDRRTGLAAALVLLSMLQFQAQAKAAQIDMTLAFMTTLSLYGLVRHLLAGPDWRWFWIGCGAAGLGVITKGVGFLPLLALLPWAWASRRGWDVPPLPGSARWWGGAAAFLGVIGLWLVPMLAGVLLSPDPDFAAYRDNILLKQTAQRYADAWGHVEPPWYFLLKVIPWAWLPVTAVVPWLVPRWREALARRDARILVLGGWVLLLVAFFSASTGKRGVYVLPAVPAVALLAAPWARELAARAGVRRVLFGLSALLVAGFALIAVKPPRGIARALEGAGAEVPVGFLGSLVAAGVLVLVLFRVRRAAAGYLALMLVTASLVGWVGYPAVTDLRSGRQLAAAFQARLPPGAEPGLIVWKEQYLLYLDRPVTHFGYRRPFEEVIADGIAWLEHDAGRVALIDDEHAECFDREGAISLGYAHREQWYLVDRDDMNPACGDGRDAPEVAVEYAPPG